MKIVAVLVFSLLLFPCWGQIKSPRAFLGYDSGVQFTSHHKILDYLKYLSTVSGNIQLQTYGKTYEGRELVLATLASTENISRLEEIRLNNLKLSGIEKGMAQLSGPVIVWLSYNVHGNEAVSSEACMETLYYLLNPANTDAASWLKNTVVILDPCMNPDGRERYVNFYSSVKNIDPDPIPFTREHIEPWPGGRTNHYYFDLNRDWAWQSQIETQQRMAVYNKWLPQVHVDFHEQGYNEPYYFAPAAEPFHQDVTKWQREFQTVIGKNNARYFDERGWLYFTKERFDLLYPSYGDTYPTYNGSIGMTYEQGGGGRAGLAVATREGDVLTLSERILHHQTTALSTVEAASANAEKLVKEFKQYFSNSALKPTGTYKTYVVKGDNVEKLKTLASLLKRNGIQYGYGASTGGQGYNYFSGRVERFTVNPTDMVINAHQPKSVLLKVLFEPNTFVSDSITYDITAWALPYAFGLQTFASKQSIIPLRPSLSDQAPAPLGEGAPVAYAANWNSVADVKFLTALLKRNVRVRYSEVAFNLAGKPLNAGSLIITRSGNENLGGRFNEVIQGIAKKEGAVLQEIKSGFADTGPDLGSVKIRHMQRPKVALLGGEEASSVAFGEVWHFFEQQIHYPISVINVSDLEYASLNDFNVIIMPDGMYPRLLDEKLSAWINDGGKLIAMQNAIPQLINKKGFDIKLKEDAKPKDDKAEVLPEIVPYAQREREMAKTNIPGAVFKVNLDNTHPLAFGLPPFYYTLKLDDRLYQYLGSGWNVGVIRKNNYVSGFVGAQTRKKLDNGLAFGVQQSGRGSVVYLADDPLFRSFWENGKLLFSNAVFMVGE